MRLSRFFKNYALITQAVFSILVYSLLGFGIGYLIDKDSLWPVVLLVVGMLLGLVFFIMTLLKLLKEEEEEKKHGKESKD